jgi:hypothetical protein
MATDSIVGGLFGMTPEAYQAQQNQMMLKQASELAQLDPLASARTSLIYGGAQLGRGLGGLMGVEDPQLKIIGVRNAVLRQTDMNDPEAIRSAASQLAQIGDLQGAYGLQDLAQKRAESSATVSLKEAQAQKAREWQAATTASERNRKLIADADIALAEGKKLTPSQESNLRVQIANELKPKIITDATGAKYQIDPIDLGLAAPNVAKYLGLGGAQTGAAGAGTTGTGAGTGVGIREIPTAAGQEEKVSQAEALNELTNRTKDVKKVIQESKDLISGFTTGYGSFLSVLPLTDAKTLQNNIDTIKSNLAFSQLTALKEASKTGASGLGAVTRNEFESLQSTISKLDPQSKNFATDLDRIDKAYTRLLDQLENKTARAERRAGVTPSAKPEVPGLSPSDIAPKQSKFSGVNPELQPTEEKPKGKPLTQDIINKANDAIKRGANPEAVRNRLKEQGYTVP